MGDDLLHVPAAFHGKSRDVAKHLAHGFQVPRFVQVGQGVLPGLRDILAGVLRLLDGVLQVSHATGIVVFIHTAERPVAFATGSGLRRLRLQLGDDAVGCGFIVDFRYSLLGQLPGTLQVFDGTALQVSQLTVLLLQGIVGGQRVQRIVGSVAWINGLDCLCQLVRLLQIHLQPAQAFHLAESRIELFRVFRAAQEQQRQGTVLIQHA